MFRRTAVVLPVLVAACSTGPGVMIATTRAERTTPTTLAAPVASTVAVPASTRPPSSPPSSSAATTSAPTTASAPSTTSPPTPPAGRGIGDPLLPELGNPGIDVIHYDIDLRYDRAKELLAGSVTLAITATAPLLTFSLDSKWSKVESVQLDGASVPFHTTTEKLVVSPTSPIGRGTTFSVKVTYTVATGEHPPAPGLGPESTGWFQSPAGSYVLNEPDGARTWLPSNDHPSDKATYSFTVTVAAGLTAIANGRLEGHQTTPAGEVWRWQEEAPMATYLIQLLTGKYALLEGQVPGGPKLLSVAIPAAESNLKSCTATTIEQISYFSTLVGPYPFDRYGLALSDMFGGLAMEDQERSLFSADDLGDCNGTAAQLLTSHELGHQWFGDAVTLARWDDIWLNESFATYMQWLWFDHKGFDSVDSSAKMGLLTRSDRSTAAPTLDDMFGTNSYDGGAVVLHALRRTIGDDKFFEVLRRWHTENFGQSRRTADFIALAERVAGRSLTKFFDDWLFAVKVPDEFPAAAVSSPTSVASPTSTAVARPSASTSAPSTVPPTVTPTSNA